MTASAANPAGPYRLLKSAMFHCLVLGAVCLQSPAEAQEEVQLSQRASPCTGTIDVLLRGGKKLRSVRGSMTYNRAGETLRNDQFDCSVTQITADVVRGITTVVLQGRNVPVRVRYSIEGVDQAGRRPLSLYVERKAQADDLLSARDSVVSEAGTYRGPRSDYMVAIPREIYSMPSGEPFVAWCRPGGGECSTYYYFSDTVFINYWFLQNQVRESEWPQLDANVKAFIASLMVN